MSRYNPGGPVYAYWTNASPGTLENLRRWTQLCSARQYHPCLIQLSLLRSLDPRGGVLHSFLAGLRKRRELGCISLGELNYCLDLPCPAHQAQLALTSQEVTERVWA